MSDVAIRIEGLGKQYRIGAKQAPYQSLRETIMNVAKAPARRLKRMWSGETSSVSDKMIWALKDVSFEVERGEVVGVIGRNGAGKTTLLKILSRITKPTEGIVDLNGRVGSLLEVGTGFHPELTGRENIYLNGAILGMRRREIKCKFDEIVAFAEIEKFLDTTVKHYSSGMYVRLAFAVAAHLEPEILLVDEVLAVGDSSFQKKCLGKMRNVAREGRTVIFVSHAMAAVHSLCLRGLVLKDGQLFFDGEVENAIRQYTQDSSLEGPQIDLSNELSRSGNGDIYITSFNILNSSGDATSVISNGQSCTFVIGYEVRNPSKSYDGVAATVAVNNLMGIRVFYHHNLMTGQSFDKVAGKGEFRLHIPRLPLSSGHYNVDLYLSRNRGHTIMDAIECRVSFEVVDGDFYGTGIEYGGGTPTSVLVDGSWEYLRA